MFYIIVKWKEMTFHPTFERIKSRIDYFVEFKTDIRKRPRIVIVKRQSKFFLARDKDMEVPVGIFTCVAARPGTIQCHARTFRENLGRFCAESLDKPVVFIGVLFHNAKLRKFWRRGK